MAGMAIDGKDKGEEEERSQKTIDVRAACYRKEEGQWVRDSHPRDLPVITYTNPVHALLYRYRCWRFPGCSFAGRILPVRWKLYRPTQTYRWCCLCSW